MVRVRKVVADDEGGSTPLVDAGGGEVDADVAPSRHCGRIAGGGHALLGWWPGGEEEVSLAALPAGSPYLDAVLKQTHRKDYMSAELRLYVEAAASDDVGGADADAEPVRVVVASHEEVESRLAAAAAAAATRINVAAGGGAAAPAPLVLYVRVVELEELCPEADGMRVLSKPSALRRAPMGDCIAIVYCGPILTSLWSALLLGEIHVMLTYRFCLKNT